MRGPSADTLGAHARERIPGEAHQHRQGNTLIEFQREDAILARLLGAFLQIFVDGHGSPPAATVPQREVIGECRFYTHVKNEFRAPGYRPAPARFRVRLHCRHVVGVSGATSIPVTDSSGEGIHTMCQEPTSEHSDPPARY